MVKGYPDFQRQMRIVAVDVDSMRKFVNVADVIEGYAWIKYYAVQNYVYRLCREPIPTQNTYSVFATNSTSRVNIAIRSWGLGIERKLHLGGDWLVAWPFESRVSGSTGHLYFNIQLIDQVDSTETVIAETSSIPHVETSTEWQLYKYFDVEYIYDYVIEPGHLLQMKLLIDGYIENSAHVVYVRFWHDPIQRPFFMLVPWKLTDYE